MTLKKEDRQFIFETAKALRAIEADSQTGIHSGSIAEFRTGEDSDYVTSATQKPVKITKEDLRSVSGRKHVRQSYQEDVVANFNQQVGVAAELENGDIFVRSIPIFDNKDSAMSLNNLKKQASSARANLQYEDED